MGWKNGGKEQTTMEAIKSDLLRYPALGDGAVFERRVRRFLEGEDA